MATEHVPVPTRAPERGATATASPWPVAPTPDAQRTPPDETLTEVAAGMPPGKALDLGCGEGAESVWLAQRGWVVTAVDPSPAAIEDARAHAAAAGVDRTIVYHVAQLGAWRPVSRYDLVACTMSLPARGSGRSWLLETAAEAVAGGGTIVLADLDISLRREGWMAEKYLVSREELERYLYGFRIERSSVRMVRHQHGYDIRMLPVAVVVATRRTDLRLL